MPALNQCNFIGHLGRDPELTYTQSGKAVCKFSIGISERKDQTEWVNVVVWEKLAETCGQYLKKGMPVFISGRLTTRKWQDKEGNDRYTTEVIATRMQMLGGKGSPAQDEDEPF